MRGIKEQETIVNDIAITFESEVKNKYKLNTALTVIFVLLLTALSLYNLYDKEFIKSMLFGFLIFMNIQSFKCYRKSYKESLQAIHRIKSDKMS